MKQTFETAFRTYEERGVLGQGGAGKVFECVDSDGRSWAVKVLDPAHTTSDRLGRFKNEYTLSLRHPHEHIVAVADVGFTMKGGSKVPFYVMPYFDDSLRALMKAGVSAARVLPFFGQVLDGVEAAHKLGVVHRDLKPENILYSKATGRLVVADFGIAQFGADLLATIVETGSGDRLANFAYAAPEQRVKGSKVDSRADIYALGLILNELFTGQIPGGTDFRTVSSVAPAFGYLDELIAGMLRQDSTKRPQSIEVVKLDLAARGNAFIERQQLDKLKGQVVPESKVSDPLLDAPPRVVHAAWDEDVLTIDVSEALNQDWMWAMRNMGNFSYMVSPDLFTSKGKRLFVPCSGEQAKAVIEHFNSWLPRIHALYVMRVTEHRRKAKEATEQAIRDQIAVAEYKARINRDLIS